MKDLHEDDIVGSVRERLSRYEEAPSEGLWDKIAASQQERKRSVWPVWVEGVALVGMGVGLFFFLNTKVVVTPGAVAAKERTVVEKNESNFVNESNKIESVTSKKTLLSANQNPIKQAAITQAVSEITPIETDSTRTSPPAIVQQKIDSAFNIIDKIIPPYKKPKSKFRFFLSLTPSLSFQKIIPNGNDELIVQGFEHRSPLSIKRFGFGIDAGFQRDINNIFGYYGGISFYHQKQQLTYFYYGKEAEVTRRGDEWTFEINRPQLSKTLDYSMTNIGVRSGLLVTLKGEKLKHKAGGGLLYSYGFAKPTSKSNYLALQLFYRNEIEVNDHLSWFVEPLFTYSFISKEKLDVPFMLKPYRAGVTFGVLYRFR